MACIQHLQNLKCAKAVEAREILAETSKYQYSRKPATSFLSRCQLDLLARDLIPDNAPANLLPVAVGTDRNCLYRAISLHFAGTKIAIKNYGFKLFLSSCSITSVAARNALTRCQWSLASLCLTIYLSSVTYGKNFKYEITEIWHVCMTSAQTDRGLGVTNYWSVGQFINSRMSKPLNLDINLENEAPSVPACGYIATSYY